MKFSLESYKSITNDMLVTVNHFDLTKEEYKVLKNMLKYIRKSKNDK